MAPVPGLRAEQCTFTPPSVVSASSSCNSHSVSVRYDFGVRITLLGQGCNQPCPVPRTLSMDNQRDRMSFSLRPSVRRPFLHTVRPTCRPAAFVYWTIIFPRMAAKVGGASLPPVDDDVSTVDPGVCHMLQAWPVHNRNAPTSAAAVL